MLVDQLRQLRDFHPMGTVDLCVYPGDQRGRSPFDDAPEWCNPVPLVTRQWGAVDLLSPFNTSGPHARLHVGPSLMVDWLMKPG